MWYYVYILYQPAKQKLYIGLTRDLKRRLGEHKKNKVDSTKSRTEKPILIFCEAFSSKEDAERREKYFKTTKGKKALKLMLRDTLKCAGGRAVNCNRL